MVSRSVVYAEALLLSGLSLGGLCGSSVCGRTAAGLIGAIWRIATPTEAIWIVTTPLSPFVGDYPTEAIGGDYPG